MTNRQNVALAINMAFQSLFAHRTKSLIVGSLLGLGTVLVTCGIALLDNIEDSISRSVIESLSGHLQIYDRDAKDKLAIYGDGAGGMPDIGEIKSFEALSSALDGFENVRALVPMGVNIASMNRGNPLELRLAAWRKAMGTESPEERAVRVEQLKASVTDLKLDLERQYELTDERRQAELAVPINLIKSMEKGDFWERSLVDPTSALETLDTEVAPFGGDGRILYLRYVGTDLKRFHSHFGRFEKVSGTLIPDGERGMLINQTFADDRLKLLSARLLDQLAEAIDEDVRIEESADLKAKARRLKTQTNSVLRLVPPDKNEAIRQRLAAELPSCTGNLSDYLDCLLNLDSTNAVRHHDLFYRVVAPHIELFPFEIGKTMTLRTWTKTGFQKAVNVKVWGTFYFKGLETSILSGAANIIDLETFRELYGMSTQAQRAELASMKADSGAVSISRESAEAQLFGGDTTPTVAAPSTAVAAIDAATDPVDMVKNVAVFLEDVSRLEESRDALNAYFERNNLPYQVLDWRDASGVIGQLAVLTRAILIIALTIIFGVAVIIINNAMVMATLERIREIGTMRAIGAQRRFMLLLVMIESLMIALAAGIIGTLVSLFIFYLLNENGIPATNDIAKFFFSGRRLYPTLSFTHVLYGLGTVALIGIAATYYPARIATRVQPIEAMKGAER